MPLSGGIVVNSGANVSLGSVQNGAGIRTPAGIQIRSMQFGEISAVTGSKEAITIDLSRNRILASPMIIPSAPVSTLKFTSLPSTVPFPGAFNALLAGLAFMALFSGQSSRRRPA
jgi:hypothetical protein